MSFETALWVEINGITAHDIMEQSSTLKFPLIVLPSNAPIPFICS